MQTELANLKVAVAQVSSIKGDVNSNINTHLKAVTAASKDAVDYLVFPELSLTGYEPELADELAFSLDDSRLKPLIEAACHHQIILGVGAPIAGEDKPYIGLIVIYPNGRLACYRKRHLHPQEDVFFAAGETQHYTTAKGATIANAICADTNNAAHAQECASAGSDVYLAGVLITEQGYEADTGELARHAQHFTMLVGMANHNAPTGGWSPCGKSAIWSPTGLLACANASEQALVVAQRYQNQWTGSVIRF